MLQFLSVQMPSQVETFLEEAFAWNFENVKNTIVYSAGF